MRWNWHKSCCNSIHSASSVWQNVHTQHATDVLTSFVLEFPINFLTSVFSMLTNNCWGSLGILPTHLQVPNGYIIWKIIYCNFLVCNINTKVKWEAQLLNPLRVAHGADLLNRNENKLAANMYTCSFIASKRARACWNRKRLQGDRGKERAKRSQEVGKENKMGASTTDDNFHMSESTSLPSERCSHVETERKEGNRRQRQRRKPRQEKKGQRKQWQVSPCVSLSVPSCHTIHR